MMRKIHVLFLVVLACAVCGYARHRSDGADADSANYILAMVRQNNASSLNSYFETLPGKAVSDVSVYTDSADISSLSVFCAAVDLGNVDVVRAFLSHGYTPDKLCEIKLFRDVIPFLPNGRDWFVLGKAKQSAGYVNSHYVSPYTGGRKTVRTLYVNPLDYARGEVFDLLWKEGFRSNNLFARDVLLKAEHYRPEVWRYIMDNQPETLLARPSYVSQADYEALLSVAKSGPNSLAYQTLKRRILGQPLQSSASARQARQELLDSLQIKLDNGSVLSADTAGYSKMDRILAVKEAALREEEEQKASAVGKSVGNRQTKYKTTRL